MDDSSAATQITPGATARSRLGSAPMPSGKRLATMTKKSSAVATSPGRRTASSRSRTTTQRAAERRTPPTSAEVHHVARGDAGILVRGEDDRSSPLELLQHERPQELDAVRVERRERLVEQPKRHARRHAQPRERRPAPLSLRKMPNRSFPSRQPEALERGLEL